MVCKILGDQRKDESLESMKLIVDNQIKKIIEVLKEETVITKITNTVVLRTTYISTSENSTSWIRSLSGNNKNFGSGSSILAVEALWKTVNLKL